VHKKWCKTRHICEFVLCHFTKDAVLKNKGILLGLLHAENTKQHQGAAITTQKCK
jgi:hypothetical protein